MTPEQASQSYVVLRQQRDAGQLPDAQFRQQVAQLVATGADGTAWQLDADSGQWVAWRPPQAPPQPPAGKAAPANRWWSISAGGCARLALYGAAYGTAGIAAIGLVAWALSKFIGGDQPPGWVIRAVALSYSSGLVYGAAGLVFNLFFKWNTSVAFGVTGVLWALGPMMAVFRNLSKGKIAGSVALASICGALVLLGWGSLATGSAVR